MTFFCLLTEYKSEHKIIAYRPMENEPTYVHINAHFIQNNILKLKTIISNNQKD